ncbi:TrkH family potassium uptake protein (plasmid) [Hoeflea sp. Naph1]|uniref:TrkH family potassium uptake protein n=1 Tax=Hoeflea sp. Naph1 TaxID=3388653 RepID=UPI003990205A
MLVPTIVDAGLYPRDAEAFLMSAAVTGGVGGMLFVAFRNPEFGVLDRRTGFLLTVSAWMAVCFFGALPFLFSSLDISFTDAMFETVSGLSTTGATVLSGLDDMAHGMLLWRSLLQWIGGVGIIVMAIAMLPMMRVGGMQLFQRESSDVSGKPFSRVNQLARAIGLVYLGLTFACTISLMLTGMNFFDAINHAMTTIATGGFSTKDASVGYFDSVEIELVITVFMTLSALPLVFYASIFLRGRRALAEDEQIHAFLKILLVAIVLCTVWNISQGMDALVALRVSAFNVTSILTDTGFATTDFSTWGSFAVGLFFLLFFVGGCAGSTSGAIKIFRWQILFASAKAHLKTTFSPSRVVVLKYQQRLVDPDTLGAVRNFLFIYITTFAVLSLAVMATGLDFLSSTSAIAQAMANAGPGLGPVVGPATNFESVAPTAKWLIIAGMLLGRLELVTAYVVILPEYWRR